MAVKVSINGRRRLFRHGWDQVIEHAPLTEQGMGAVFGSVGFQMPVVAKRLAGRAQQGEQHHRESVEQPQPVSTFRRVHPHGSHPHAET